MTRKGCYGRGILAFETFKPARRPGESTARKPVVTGCTDVTPAASGAATEPKASQDNNDNTVNQAPVAPVSDGKRPVKLLAKYNYKANENRPGGFDELSLKQGEKLEFSQAHPVNPYWWQAKNSDDQLGYVPASYVMVLEEKVTSLPWLEQKREAERKEEEEERNKNPGAFGSAPPGTWKPYVSAYNHNIGKTPQQARQWYCEICDKQLNGPKPYQAHIVSRAHKDELEAQGIS